MWIFFLMSVASMAWSQDQVDLSVGSAIPSNNGSIRENPAGLPRYQNKIFDISTLFGTGGTPLFQGSLASGKGSFGYGLKIDRLVNDFAFTAAVGAQTGAFSMGLNVNFLASTWNPTFDLGVIQSLKSLNFAVIFRNLSNFGRNWIFSFGFNPAKYLRFGFDFDFQSTFFIVGVFSARTVLVAELFSNQKYAFRLSYGLNFIPTLTNSSGLGAGLIFWLGKKTSLYGIYHDYVTNMTYTLGMKFSL